MKKFNIKYLNICLPAVALLLGSAKISQAAVPSCTELGYASGISCASKVIKCPTDTSYSFCADEEKEPETPAVPMTCEEKKASGLYNILSEGSNPTRLTGEVYLDGTVKADNLTLYQATIYSVRQLGCDENDEPRLIVKNLTIEDRASVSNQVTRVDVDNLIFKQVYVDSEVGATFENVGTIYKITVPEKFKAHLNFNDQVLLYDVYQKEKRTTKISQWDDLSQSNLSLNFEQGGNGATAQISYIKFTCGSGNDCQVPNIQTQYNYHHVQLCTTVDTSNTLCTKDPSGTLNIQSYDCLVRCN